MYKAVSILAIGLAVAASAFAGIYKWTDAEGNVYYGERPPSGSEPREMQAAPPPRGEDAERDRDRWDRILEQQRRSEQLRREDKQMKQQEKAERQQQEAERKRLCAGAYQNLHVLEQHRPVYMVDEKGERVFVDADRRASEIAQLRKFIAEECQ